MNIIYKENFFLIEIAQKEIYGFIIFLTFFEMGLEWVRVVGVKTITRTAYTVKKTFYILKTKCYQIFEVLVLIEAWKIKTEKLQM